MKYSHKHLWWSETSSFDEVDHVGVYDDHGFRDSKGVALVITFARDRVTTLSQSSPAAN